MPLDIEGLREIFLKKKVPVNETSKGQEQGAKEMKTTFFDGHGIRHFEENGKTFICGVDLSRALGYKKSAAVYENCDENDIRRIGGSRGKPKSFFSSDSVLAFLEHSRAKRSDVFSEWVKNLVSGKQEQAPQQSEKLPQSYAEALRELAKQVEEKEALQAQLEAEQAKPKLHIAELAKPEAKSRRVQVLMKPSLYKQLHAKAKQQGDTMNNLINRVVSGFVQESEAHDFELE